MDKNQKSNNPIDKNKKNDNKCIQYAATLVLNCNKSG